VRVSTSAVSALPLVATGLSSALSRPIQRWIAVGRLFMEPLCGRDRSPRLRKFAHPPLYQSVRWLKPSPAVRCANPNLAAWYSAVLD